MPATSRDLGGGDICVMRVKNTLRRDAACRPASLLLQSIPPHKLKGGLQQPFVRQAWLPWVSPPPLPLGLRRMDPGRGDGVQGDTASRPTRRGQRKARHADSSGL